MKLHELKPNKGARKDKYRVGRGMAQGRGKQAGKGQSGQNKRHGHRAGFEGGQTPWFRRLPKFGFNNYNHVEYQVVSLTRLDDKFKDGDVVEIANLFETKICRDKNMPVKLLATGKLSKKLTVKVNAASATAIKAVEQAGGTVEIVK